MKHKKTITCVAFLLLGLGGLQAQQQVTVAAGGEAAGIGGISSYSVGQVAYTTIAGANGSVSQGVQQSYEISIITGAEIKSIDLELSTYPNPTTNNLTLEVEDANDLNFQLYNLQGNLILNETVTNNVTRINLKEQATAVYFLKVLKKNQEIKTFKIIKN